MLVSELSLLCWHSRPHTTLSMESACLLCTSLILPIRPHTSVELEPLAHMVRAQQNARLRAGWFPSPENVQPFPGTSSSPSWPSPWVGFHTSWPRWLQCLIPFLFECSFLQYFWKRCVGGQAFWDYMSERQFGLGYKIPGRKSGILKTTFSCLLKCYDIRCSSVSDLFLWFLLPTRAVLKLHDAVLGRALASWEMAFSSSLWMHALPHTVFILETPWDARAAGLSLWPYSFLFLSWQFL